MGAAPDVLQYPVQLLRTVADTDGKYQEWHQDRERIQLIPQRRQQSQLPHHRQQGTTYHHQRGAQAAAVPVQQCGGNQHRDGEKAHHHDQAVNEVADQLGKAHDMDGPVGVVTGKLRPDLFQLVAQFSVVQPLAGLGIPIQQGHDNGGRLFVIANQVAHDAGAGDIDPDRGDRLGGAVVIPRYHRPPLEAQFGDSLPAGVRCPDRLHTVAIHPRHEEYRLVYLLDIRQVLGSENSALPDRHHHPQVVTQTFQLDLVGAVVEYIGVALGQGLLEARLQLDAGGLVSQHQGDQQAQRHHDRAMIEDQLLQESAGLKIEVPKVRNDRQVRFRCASHL